MPRFHDRLKEQLDFECLDYLLQPSDEDAEDEHYEATQRAAKRRRIEAIAAQCMRGRPPLILSAGLRGPFDKGWKNPWVKKPSKLAKAERAAGLEHKQRERRMIRHAQDARAKDNHSDSRRQAPSSVPSPETSRAITAMAHVLPVMDKQNHAEAPSCNPPSQGDDSEGTDVSSMSEVQPINVDRSESNPLWLRRQSKKKTRLKQSENGNYNRSPTRTRNGSHRISKAGGLRLAPPKAPLAKARSSPVKATVLRYERRSKASKSMAVSSPVAPIDAVLPELGRNSSPNVNQRSATSLLRQHIGVTTRPADTSELTDSMTLLSESNISASNASVEAKEQTLSVRTTRSRSKNTKTPMTEPDQREPGERSSTFTPINARSHNGRKSSAFDYTNLLESTDATAILLQDAPPCIATGHHAATNLALLAVDAARTRRPPARGEAILGSAERCGSSHSSSKVRGSGGKVKPGPIGHASKPASAVTPSQRTPSVVIKSKGGRRDIYEVPSSEERERQSTSRSHQQSGYSTQAAMMLARLEFQEGSVSSLPAGTPGLQMSGQDDNAEQDADEPSLELEPFSAFNAKLDQRHAQEKASDELPISTQELFSAASPFALSTVKKAAKSQGSGLRFAVFPSSTNELVERHSDAKSPTPSQRMPLKERNSMAVVQNRAQGKGSQGSRSREPTLAEHEIELPQLDFGASGDDVGPNGDLDLTDRFLRNLDNHLT